MSGTRTFKLDGSEPPLDVTMLVDREGYTLERDGADWVLNRPDGTVHEAGPAHWNAWAHMDGTWTEVRFSAETEERLAALFWEPEMSPPPARVGMIRLLEQDVWWKPKDGDPVRVEEIDDRWRGNLIRFLERRAERLKFKYELSLITGPQPSGDMACDAFDSACSALFDQSALEWLRDQPLYRRLNAAA